MSFNGFRVSERFLSMGVCRGLRQRNRAKYVGSDVKDSECLKTRREKIHAILLPRQAVVFTQKQNRAAVWT